jgi:release factor glutamine methyltransferase
VLIPRPETECLVEAALSVLAAMDQYASGDIPVRVLELGTGSGAVVLSLASERPGLHYFASDLSVQALGVARGNAMRNDLSGSVLFFSGDWFCPLSPAGGAFDVILSNPPYIPTAVIAGLQREIRRYEPKSALDGGDDGLACLGRIIPEAENFLKPGGCLLLEIGYDQKERVSRIIDRCGIYEKVEFHKDYHGVDRVVQMRKKICLQVGR